MKKIISYLIIFINYFLILNYAEAQVERAQLIAAYINNFIKYTEWPEEDKLNSYNIAVFTDDSEIKKQFQELASRKLVKRKKISVNFYTRISPLQTFQLIFVAKDKLNYLIELYDLIEGKPILLVSEEYPDKRIIMINLYSTIQNKMGFEVNKANILNQNLNIDPEILLIGGTEIDVAALYRKSQVTLRSMQKDMERLQDSIKTLQTGIDQSINLIEEQKAEIEKQKLLINEINEQIKLQQQLLAEQENFLLLQKDSIKSKDAFLKSQQELIKNNLEENKKLEAQLNERLENIEKLNQEITLKNKELGTKTETIEKQKQILMLFYLIGFLVLILIITVTFALINNRKKNKILISQTKLIEEKLKQLEELNEKLKLADQYKSIFLASMSHELRTPLNSIIGYTGILLMGMTGKLNEEQVKQLTKVKNNAKHLLSLINDILDISKIESGKIELAIEEFKVNDLINEIVEIIFPKASEKNLKINVDLPEDIFIKTDKRRLKQVILNLASNAVNYTDEGSIDIKLQRVGTDTVRISVKDTGIGIPEEDMKRLFQPFQQIDSSLTKKNKGTGLGLYLCRKLITLLNGKIYLISEVGVGSEFFVELPINK